MKKILKSIMLVGITALLTTTNSFAQDTHEHHDKQQEHKEMQAKKFEEASKRLNLTADQQAKLKTILEQNKVEMKALREANKDKPKDEKRALAMTQMKKLDGQISAILDTKQQEIYKQMKEEKKAAMKKKHEENMKNKSEMESMEGLF